MQTDILETGNNGLTVLYSILPRLLQKKIVPFCNFCITLQFENRDFICRRYVTSLL